MKRLVIAISLILVPTACAGQANPPEQTSTLSVRGKVLQDPDGQPIRKANIQLIGQSELTATVYSATSDAEGQFTIDDIQPGQYVAILDRSGFVQSGTGNRRIWVQSGKGKDDLILRMQPAGVITGKIVDLDGDPMSDVDKVCRRKDRTKLRRTRTNDTHRQGCLCWRSAGIEGCRNLG